MNYPNPYYNNYQPQPMYYPNNGAIPDMLGQYKSPYQSMQQPSQAPMQNPLPTQPVSSGNEMLWVLGEVEATSYPVAPGNTVVLWDKDQPTVFIKSVNTQGVPSIKILDYTERTPNAQKSAKFGEVPNEKFVSVEKFQELEQRLNTMHEELEAISSKYRSKNSKNIKDEVENG